MKKNFAQTEKIMRGGLMQRLFTKETKKNMGKNFS